jgi:hypothetical protein
MSWWDWLLPPRRPLHIDDDHIVQTEKDASRRDLEQVKRLNEYLLNKAVARGYVSPEVAAAIRATQRSEEGKPRVGPDK